MAEEHPAANSPLTEFDEQLFLLNFATRLLTAFTDKQILIDNSLEILADFSHARRLAVMTIDDDDRSLLVEGVWAGKPFRIDTTRIPLANPALKEVCSMLSARTYPLRMDGKVPLPAPQEEGATGQCLCVPLGGASFRLVGVATFEILPENRLTFQDLQNLRVLATVLAISLDNAKLFAQAVYDGLTGIYIRRYYEIRVKEELSMLKRQPGRVAIILFDMDNFKRINDRFGHLAGDRVLCAFAGLMKANVRQHVDVICRYGGDEFIILLPGTGLNEAVEIAERLRALFEGLQFDDLPRDRPFTVSAGVASTDHRKMLPAEEMLQSADLALYKAKQTGGNRVVAWPQGQNDLSGG
ncbi:MAG: sensor domain-containing diguanylate cyclase [Syntrophobacteraceae bacterium]|nr:sensor domain-containing diguanylate cyclase [Desulfobacteraceae bacterium]